MPPQSPLPSRKAARRALVRISTVRFEAEMLVVTREDGREIAAPLGRFPFLQQATKEQRDGWMISPGGSRLLWPALNSQISLGQLRHCRRRKKTRQLRQRLVTHIDPLICLLFVLLALLLVNRPSGPPASPEADNALPAQPLP